MFMATKLDQILNLLLAYPAHKIAWSFSYVFLQDRVTV